MNIYAETWHFGHHSERFEAATLAEAIEKVCEAFDNRYGLPKYGKSRIIEFWIDHVNIARYVRGKVIVRRGAKSKYPAFFEVTPC
jgi:hypothetical protein